MRSTTQFTLYRCLAAILLATGLLTLPSATSEASSHREAPAITLDPTADNTDVYAFVSFEEGQQEFVTLIANFIPLQDAAAGPNFHKFNPSVLYEIMIDNDGDALEDIVYQFRFRTRVLENGTFLNATGPITALDDATFNVRQSYSVTRVEGSRRSRRSPREVLGGRPGGSASQHRGGDHTRLQRPGRCGNPRPARWEPRLRGSTRRRVLRRPGSHL